MVSFSYMTDKPRPNASPVSLPALYRSATVGDVSQMMMDARQTIAVIIIINCN